MNLGGDQELGSFHEVFPGESFSPVGRSSVSFWLSQGTKSSVAIQLQVMTWDLSFKMGSCDVNSRAIDTLDFVNVTLVFVFGSLIFQHGWSGFASMNFGSGKNIAITQDKTWLRQGISISRIFDGWSHWTHWRQCFFHVRSTWPGQ